MKNLPRSILTVLTLTSASALGQTQPPADSAPATPSATATPAPAVTTTPPAVVKLGSGFSYIRGDFGFTQDTELWSVPVNVSYDLPRWSLKAAFSWLSIKGPANIASGSAPVGGAPRPTSSTESGIGDTSLAATFHAHDVPGDVKVDLTGRVKLPTADEDKGLGSGETDYYVQTDLSQTFGQVTVFATLGYRFMGSNATNPLKDGPFATAGAAYAMAGGKAVVGAAYDWQSRTLAGADPGSNLIGFIATSPNDRWTLVGFGLVGFNDASPELGLGGLATYKF
ncbi:hypothetical protein [Opitutus terrae]|uniref:Transporter n=1 Tax=Opitutus terrae (strain DSM 11246 / JCM 15787 / PB90-1) TaxID=452637 RepID=B1ZUU1_OPITP|nr:hypothetical protein [Opitutus terrae]ACB74975.1 conserved hypothetical protein [Opitutus terrae PB90-1]